MPLPERDARGRMIYVVLTAVSLLTVIYVAYVHLLAARHTKVSGVADFNVAFGAESGLPEGATVRTKGNLLAKPEGDALVVRGDAEPGDELVVLLPARRYEDALASLVFEAPDAPGVEVFVGLEDAHEESRKVTAGYVTDPAAPLAYVGGDTSGPYRDMRAWDDARAPGDAKGRHNVALQFAPMFGAATGLVDGMPRASVSSGWLRGTEARLFFGVRFRERLPGARVALDGLGLRTVDWTLPSFEDGFSGEFVDPQRYDVTFPDPAIAKLDMSMAKGGGVVLDAKAHAVFGDHVPLFMLRTSPFLLRDLTVKVDLTVEELDEASVFFGLMGSSAWTPADRIFDVAVSKRGEPEANVFSGGSWTGTGGLSFDPIGKAALPYRVKIEIRYDAATRKGTSIVDGKTIGEHVLDLKPLDFVALRVGADGYAARARARVKVHAIAVEQR